MSRVKRKSVTIKDPQTLAVLGVLCLVASMLLFVSLFVDSQALQAFRSFFGVGLPVMSLVLFLTGLRLLGAKRDYNSFRVILMLLIFLFSFLGWIHLFTELGSSYELAQQGKYGGKLGYWISSRLKEFSIEVAFAILSLGLITSLASLFNINPRTVSEKIAYLIDFLIVLAKWTFVRLKSLFQALLLVKQKIDSYGDFLLNAGGIIRTDSSNKGSIPSKTNEVVDQGINPDNQIKMVSDISSLIDNHGTSTKPGGPDNMLNNTDSANTRSGVNNTKDDASSSQRLEKRIGTSAGMDLSVRRYPNWQLPPIDLLDPLKPKQQESKVTIEKKANAIIETLKSFNIEAKVLGYTVGPTVTQFFIDPAAGVKFSKIASLSKDLALTLASLSDLRIELVPGKSYIGIDVPNDVRQTTQLIESIMPIYKDPAKYKLGLAVGIDNQGTAVCKDLASAPHMLIAGATGQGKSVLINAFIISLLMMKSPDELKFIMIDPKMVEMAPYEGVPHLLTSPITDMSKASKALKWAVNEMEERYKILKEARVRNIEDYVSQTGNLMPYIVVVVDEFSDLMMQYRQEVETSIIRLAQKSRAVGIHLIIATQRPTSDVITGLIKSNVPTRVALAVASSIDSRVILDSTGAETLLGRGDLLIKTANDLKPMRVQGLYIDDKGKDSEFHRILNFIKSQVDGVEYNDDAMFNSLIGDEDYALDGDDIATSRDPLFKQAAEIVVSSQKGSASLLQTKMKIGYARAARLIDELESAGIVGPQDGPRPREVLVSDLDSLYAKMRSDGNSN